MDMHTLIEAPDPIKLRRTGWFVKLQLLSFQHLPESRFCRTYKHGRLKRPSFRPTVRPFVHPSVNIFHGCLVSATPLTVLYRSFWKFACVFFIVWGYACGLQLIVRLFFITFSSLWTAIFHPQYIVSGYVLWAQLLLQFVSIGLKPCMCLFHGMRIC